MLPKRRVAIRNVYSFPRELLKACKLSDPQSGALTLPTAPGPRGGGATGMTDSWSERNSSLHRLSLSLSLFRWFQRSLHSSAHGKAEEQQRSALTRGNALRDFTREAAIRWFYGTRFILGLQQNVIGGRMDI